MIFFVFFCKTALKPRIFGACWIKKKIKINFLCKHALEKSFSWTQEERKL
jgi:hypothetical protein